MISTSQIKLQPIEYCYINKCADLFILVFNSPPWDEMWKQQEALNRLEDCYNTPESYGVVATVNDEVVGFAIGYVEKWYDGKHFYLKEMCVKSSNQRSGIGTKIFNTLSQSLISQDVNQLYLLTMRDSIAEAFYKKCGFDNSKMIVISKTN